MDSQKDADSPTEIHMHRLNTRLAYERLRVLQSSLPGSDDAPAGTFCAAATDLD